MTKETKPIPIANWYYSIKRDKVLNRIFESSIQDPNSSAIKAILFNNFSVPMSEKFECITDIFKSVMLHCKESNKLKQNVYSPTHFHRTNKHPYFWKTYNGPIRPVNQQNTELTVAQRMWRLPDIDIDDFNARRTEVWNVTRTTEEYADTADGTISTETIIRSLIELELADGDIYGSNVDNLLDELTAECADDCDYQEGDSDDELGDHIDTTDSSWSSYNNGTVSNILHRLNTLSPEHKATVEEYIESLNGRNNEITLDYIIRKLTIISL